MPQRRIGQAALELVQGDITRERTEAIVNAANPSLLGGGGVDGAIHRAGGPTILEECKRIRASRGSLPTGQAVLTTGGKLAARHVIHTVGPVWHGGERREPDLLAECYRSCIAIAREAGLISIAFPSISTGVYGYPVELAAPVALRTVAEELVRDTGSLRLARFVLFDAGTLAAYEEAFEQVDRVTGAMAT